MADSDRTERRLSVDDKGGAAPVPDTPDPIEIAMGEVNASGAGAVSMALLADQRRLIAAQIAQLGRQRLRDVMVSVLFGLLIIGAIALVWSAVRAKGVVVQPFAVPADLEGRGLTGPVAAAEFLDKLNAMQAETKSARAASTYADNWGDDIKAEVPYAGVSFGELRRLLRESLGSETRLSGEIVRLDGDRVALTMRAGSAAARVEGNAADLDRLMSDGARAMYKATQPYRYATWVAQTPGGAAERRAVLLALSRSNDINEKLWALHGLSIAASSTAEARAYQSRALRLKPDFMPVLGNVAGIAFALGHEEDAYQAQMRAVAAYEAGQSDYDPGHAARYRLYARARLSAGDADLLEAARLEQAAMAYPADRSNELLGPFTAARRWAAVHDFAAAKQTLFDAGVLDPTSRAEIEREFGPQPSIEDFFAQATGDVVLELNGLDRGRTALMQALARPDIDARLKGSIKRQLAGLNVPYALAHARGGAADKAVAAAALTPIDSDDGIRARGLAAAANGDAQASEAWFRKAVARTPSLPIGHTMWAEARLMRGDFAGAIEQAKLANGKGPQSAEPLRTWGLALLQRGDATGAAAKFEMASARAPQWGALYLDWGNALWRTGAFAEGRAKLAAAQRLSLSEADRVRLSRMTNVMATRK